MDTAGLSRFSRESGARKTRGLCVIVSLLYLVCIAESLLAEDSLEKMIEDLGKMLEQQQMERLKAAHSDAVFASEIFEDLSRMMNPLMAIMRMTAAEFPPVLELMEALRVFIEKSKDYLNVENEIMAARLQDAKRVFQKQQELLKLMKQSHVEL